MCTRAGTRCCPCCRWAGCWVWVWELGAGSVEGVCRLEGAAEGGLGVSWADGALLLPLGSLRCAPAGALMERRWPRATHLPAPCLQVLGLNLLITYAGHSFIDSAGHIGGLLGGAALMLLVGPRYRWASGAEACACLPAPALGLPACCN
jgi:hypothetical protein